MPYATRQVIRAAAACFFAALVFAASARAQVPAPQPLEGPGTSPDFLTRYDFQLSASSLAQEDQRFSWDTNFGGTLDVVDYVVGRFSAVGNYETILGNEFRRFDPNQATYTLELSASVWAGPVETAAVFHHVSRHLSDRPKRIPIAWNVLGARALRRLSLGDTVIWLRGDVGRVIAHANADYGWMGDFDMKIRRPVNSHFGAYAHGYGELVGIDSSLSRRNTQRGLRAEAGVALSGRAGTLELFAGYEQRVDAAPFDLMPLKWALAGFRLVNK